jgi:hypothetical protein
VHFAGDNLFDASSISLNSNTSLKVEGDGYKITVVGGTKGTYTYSGHTIPIDLVRGKTVFVQIDNLTTTNAITGRSIIQARVKKADGTTSYSMGISASTKTRTVSIPADAQSFTIAIMTNNAAEKLETDCTMVVEGLRVSFAEDTEWKPYYGQTLYPFTPNGISGIPVTEGGNYTDVNGQQ